MGKKQFQQPYTGICKQVSARCTPRQKMRFDQIVSATNKSKTELINELINQKYKEIFVNRYFPS